VVRARKLRLGVIGCGGVTTIYNLPALRCCPWVEAVALVDVDGARARRVARRFGVPHTYDDYRELVGRVDAALVATPNAAHAEIACTLLERGIHVLCEKPMATSVADVDRMLASSAHSGARLMAAHCLRFSPNFGLLRDLVDAGWLGELREISAGIGSSYDVGAHRTDFRRRRTLAGGGVLIDLGIHVIDLALWLTGSPPSEVAYDGASVDGWEVETDAEVALKFAGGCRAHLRSSFTHALENVFFVRGSEGWATVPLYEPQLTLFSDRARLCRKSGSQRIMLPDQSMYERQLQHFCEAVTSAGQLLVKPEEVRAGIEVVERCYGGGGWAR
jgi:predicted dehydrogenase